MAYMAIYTLTLTALVADFAIHLKCDADQLDIEWVILPDAPSHHSTRGIYITGMWLVNAGLDTRRNTVCQPRPNDLCTKFPIVSCVSAYLFVIVFNEGE
jgi:hypothetical protein